MGRTLAVALVGVWLGLLIASWAVATANFRVVDHVLGPGLRPEADERMHAMSPADRRAVLRHLASEANRTLFRVWLPLQAAMGFTALVLIGSGAGVARPVLAVALGLLALQGLALTGPIVELGRGLDFLPRPLPADLARRFGRLHAAYVGSDLIKAAALAAVVWLCARRPSP